MLLIRVYFLLESHVKKITVSLFGALFLLVGCGEKEETPAVDPMHLMSEKIDREDGIRTCKVDAVTFGENHEVAAKACVKNTSIEICEKYFAKAVCVAE